jgi:hypothetical protein
MLAEIFMLRLEAAARVAKFEAATPSRFVPITLHGCEGDLTRAAASAPRLLNGVPATQLGSRRPKNDAVLKEQSVLRVARRVVARCLALLSTGGLGRVRYGSPTKCTPGGLVPYAEQQPRLAGATVEQN